MDRQNQEVSEETAPSDSRRISDIIPEISDEPDNEVVFKDESLKNVADTGLSKPKSLKRAEDVDDNKDILSPQPKSLKKADEANNQKKTRSLKKLISNVKSSKTELSKESGEVKNQNNLVPVNKDLSKPQSLEKVEEDENISAVDSLVSDIVPGYNSDISIEVEHVNLSFEVATDRIDTLKESFIRTIKRTKSKKIKFQALKDISFKIYQGEKVGIIGYNGAGKSTLLKVVTGIYPPDEGKVVTRGNISPLLSLGAGFDRNYSGRKNIYLNGAVLGYSKKFLQDKEKEIIEFSELDEFIDFPIRNYSSGMIAKLGFSIATMVNPDILIIDEILSVGDVNFKRKSSDKIKSLMDGKTTVLLVSHSIPQIRSLCDRAIWIDKGEIREIGDVNEVCNHYLKDSEKASKEQLRNIQFR